MSDVRGPATGVSGYVESLKRDRDRYLALAFCAADLLVEVGSGGKIHFCAGAAQSLLGLPPEELIGRQFDSVLTEADKALVKEVMSRLAPGARIDPVQLRLTGESGPTAPLTLMGYHLPDQPGQFYLAFRVGAPEAAIDGEFDAERDPESGLLQKEAFAKLASRQIKQARDRGETLKFTVMKVPELAALRDRIGGDEAAKAMKTFGACLKANAAMGQAAGYFEDDAYDFLHDQKTDPDAVAHRVESVFKAADPEGRGVAIDSGSLDADLDDTAEEDAVKVMLYTVRRF